MRTKMFIAIALLLLALAIFVAIRVPGGGAPYSNVRFQFVGFQNATNGTFNAVFYTTNWPREGTSWTPADISYRSELGWTSAVHFPRNLRLVVQNPTNITVYFQVPNTNVPLRTITVLRSDPPGWKNHVNDSLRPFGIRNFFHGRVRWITNEITSAQQHLQ